MIDLRSDTVTKPTEKMRRAMAEAEVGDDVYGDDPSVNRLEALAADRLGKEASLFVPSGTFGNQLALFTHCRRGQEILVGENCHIVVHEAGAPAVIAGVQLRTLPSPGGLIAPEAVSRGIRPENIHFPETGLLCLENAHSTGRVLTVEEMEQSASAAHRYGIPVHLDGARLFNAASRLGVDAETLSRCCDSVMFCLSKGLCAPIGSMLVGSREFIEAARKKRKIMGGGLRQAGILAAAGLIALEEMTTRLDVDHANARKLGEALNAVSGITVDREGIDINMVFFRIETGVDEDKIVEGMHRAGYLINGPEEMQWRLVTHEQVPESAIPRIVECLAELARA